MIKNPSILILDEATSALDSESESLVNEALVGLMNVKNTTTISIAHRISTIKQSDQIIVLSTEGVVAEVGSFNELLADPNSALRNLLKAQAGDLATGSEDPDPITDNSANEQELDDFDGKNEDLVDEELDQELAKEGEEQEKRDTSGIDIKQMPKF